jgi:EPS-associated MarR family transcriptional regulator
MQAEIDLKLLKLIEENPALSQRQLADRLGISLGKTNYCLRALKEKGLVKWGNFSNNPHKLKYMHLLTPKGIGQKLSLTVHFLERKQAEFERLKKEIVLLQAELDQQELQLDRVKDSKK